MNAITVVIDDYRNTAENGKLIWALRMADSAAAELARLQRVEQAAIHAYEFITRASFDFTNGNNVFGVDEGEVIGRRACNELERELAAALGEQ